ncbi:hypothetical protein ScPMuIL_011066 [Solemya velum]
MMSETTSASNHLTNATQSAKNRLFYSLPDSDSIATGETDTEENNKHDLFQYINDNVIGHDKIFSGPFGLREVTYLDFTASGRALAFIEDYVRNEVLPEYGNTHTTTSVTSLQTTLYRHEARDIIRNAVHASEHDAVIFVGSGCTAAIHKLVHALDLHSPPIVFVGPYEHHSVLLPWREYGAKVVKVRASECGQVDTEHLEELLKKFKLVGCQLIGCFSAASNVTGILTDVDAVTVCLHRHGALALWDYATAAPYVKIDMNPVIAGPDQPLAYKDAVFISPHKFVGGVSTPGILIAKKSLFRNQVPDGCGGGTVFFVRRDGHRYLQEPELKEEGGTPAIVEAIRAGMVFQLKEAITSDVIMAREHQLCRKAKEAFSQKSGLVILARGGCACAGPYAMDQLGLDEETAMKIEELLAEDSRLDRTHLRRYKEYSDREILRPGFTRINLPYFVNDETVDFVIEAVELISEHGWKLLPQYMFNPETGEWRHRTFQVFKDRKWLGHISYTSGKMTYKVPPLTVKGPLPTGFRDCLDRARILFHQAEKAKNSLADQSLMFDEESNKFRWFLLPSEAADCLQGSCSTIDPHELPFCPPCLREKLGLPLFKEGSNEEYVNFSGKFQKENRLLDVSYSRNSENSAPLSSTTQRPLEADSVITSEELRNCQQSEFSSSISNDNQTNDNTRVSTDNSVPLENNSLHDSAECDVAVVKTLSEMTLSVTPHCDIPVSDVSDIHLPSVISESEAVTCDIVGNQAGHSSSEIQHGSRMNGKRQSKSKWFSPPKSIFSPFIQAVEEFDMVRDGDKILVCLSGGKDSLSLLHTIRQYQFYCRGKGISLQFGAVTVDPQTPSYDPSPLKDYLASLQVPYFYEAQCIMETASNLPYECDSICSFCSRMKRGRIYSCARREGYNVLALGQHLDDLSESFLMSFFHNGTLRTMKAHYTVKEGDLRVIRPFVYVREKDLRVFAEKNKLPVIAENCPACFEAPKERHRTKQLLAAQEILFPQVYNSMLAAMKPIMAINKTGLDMKRVMGAETPAVNVCNDDDLDI